MKKKKLLGVFVRTSHMRWWKRALHQLLCRFQVEFCVKCQKGQREKKEHVALDQGTSRCWGVLLNMWIKYYKVFSFSIGSCAKSDKCPQVISLESASVEDYKFENETNLLVWSWKEVSLPDPLQLLLISVAGYRLLDTLAASITHPRVSSPTCTVGNVGNGFFEGRRMCGITKTITLLHLCFN